MKYTSTALIITLSSDVDRALVITLAQFTSITGSSDVDRAFVIILAQIAQALMWTGLLQSYLNIAVSSDVGVWSSHFSYGDKREKRDSRIKNYPRSNVGLK